jgi:hypothetical protein
MLTVFSSTYIYQHKFSVMNFILHTFFFYWWTFASYVTHFSFKQVFASLLGTLDLRITTKEITTLYTLFFTELKRTFFCNTVFNINKHFMCETTVRVRAVNLSYIICFSEGSSLSRYQCILNTQPPLWRWKSCGARKLWKVADLCSVSLTTQS